MPFGNPRLDPQSTRRFEAIYSDWIRPTVEGVLVCNAESERLECHRADRDPRSGEIIAHVIESLADSELVIADLTGKNPNVFYELGVRHALRNRTILIAQDVDDIPFDLRGLRAISYEYEPESLVRFRRSLEAAVKEVLVGEDRVDNPVRRYLHDREVAKVLASSAPPGDFVKELIYDMKALRGQFASLSEEVRAITEQATLSPAQTSEDSSQLRIFEGAWRALENDGFYYARFVDGQMRIAFCYQGNEHLSGYFYNIRVMGDRLLARFKWSDSPIAGCGLLRAESHDRLAGGWWYQKDLPESVRRDIARVVESLPGMQTLTLERVRGHERFPEWAEAYFRTCAVA